MTTEQTIPLQQLVASQANVRRTGKTEGIDELAASIAAHGLRQNLNVMPTADGRRFEVVAGGRRLKALKQLAKAGKIARNAGIPCLVLDETDDAAEISLAENTVRQAMHPDDQFEAFQSLIRGKGLSIEEVAARFGVTPAVVRQRLKLAAVSPKLRALYRKGEMGLEHVMALTLSDDHAAQEDAWASLPDWNRDPESLRDALTKETVPMTDRLARFVGVEAYMAAGGAVLRDLFGSDEDGFLSDRALLTRLAHEKIEAALESVRAEGWQWVRAELTRDYGTWYRHLPCRPDDEAGDDDETAIVYTADELAMAGALVSLSPDGTLHIERGLMLPGAAADGSRKAKAPADPSGLSAAMVEELTGHRTAALRIGVARHPGIALAATVHAMALSLLYHGGSQSCLTLRAASEDLDRHVKEPGDCAAHAEMAREGERWGETLPEDATLLFAWCLGQTQEVLLALLAYLAALTVDAVRARQGNGGRLDHADELAEALSLDMRRSWTPSLAGFYERLPKAALAAMVSEAKAPLTVSLATLKKPDAARCVAKAMEATGWLPEPLKAMQPLAA